MSARNKTIAKRSPKTGISGGAKHLSGGAKHLSGAAKHLSGAAKHLAGGEKHPASLGGEMPETPSEKDLAAIGKKTAVFAAGEKRLTVAIGREAAASFKAWFERNFANPRAGRIGALSYSRAGSLDDRRGDPAWYSDAYGRAFWDHTEPLKPDEEDYLRSHPLVMLQLALGVTDLRGLRCMRRGLTLRTNALQQKSYRSRYYARDNARRRQLAAKRRKIRRRTTTNPCPTPDEFREAFARVTESVEAKVLFGGMVHDLACYVDSCLRYDESGNIVGRNGGIRAWIAENAPELSPRYKTIMRYKALAMRVRQLAGLKDPQPTSALLGQDEKENVSTGNEVATMTEGKAREGVASGNGEKNRTETAKKMGLAGNENYYAQDSHYRERLGERDICGTGRGPERKKPKEQELEMPDSLARKRESLRRMLAECRNTFKDVFDRIDSKLG